MDWCGAALIRVAGCLATVWLRFRLEEARICLSAIRQDFFANPLGIAERLFGAIMGESRGRVVVCLLSFQQEVLQFHAHLLLEDARVNELFVELSKNLAMAGI